LPGYDRWIAVRVDERRPVLIGERPCVLECGLELPTVQHHLGTVAAGGIDLRLWGRLRHYDRRLEPRGCCGECDALGVIPRAGGHDLFDIAVTVAQFSHFVRGLPGLERSRTLEVLHLEKILAFAIAPSDRLRLTGVCVTISSSKRSIAARIVALSTRAIPGMMCGRY